MVTVMHKPNSQPVFADNDARWDAVEQRDPSADGEFVYSVATTGVYCRPSCPSRRARRGNVRFHETVEAAETAGFRPCKRCRPDELSLKQRHTAMVESACRAIEAAEEPPSLDELAAAAGVSRYHFHRIFKAVTGVTRKLTQTRAAPSGCKTNLLRRAT